MAGRKGSRAGGGGGPGREERRVLFPCDVPQWTRVREEIELVLQSSGLANVAAKLDNLHHISQAREGTDVRCVAVFRALGQFLLKVDEDERRRFHQVSLPTILKRALQLPDCLSEEGVPLLLKQKPGHVVLSRRLVASIVACGFLCLFPASPAKQKDNFRSINFTNFFQHLSNEPQQAKLRCILHYFERLAQDVEGPTGNLICTRKVLEHGEAQDLDCWQQTDIPLCPLFVHQEGLIEDTPHPAVQVDFANKKIGGGVLATGRVQEEIRFVTCPECLVTMLIFEGMDENEAIWVQGFETFSAHTGYAKTLRYAGDFKDNAPVDSRGNLRTILCAIDALTSASQRQYQDNWILRDVNKAFIGFLQKCTDRTEEDRLADVENYGERLTEEIITTAAHQAALVLTQSRLQEHARPPSSGERLSHKDRSDSSDTSSDSLGHHSTSFGIGEGDRSWMMGMRRRSSNLSDVGSRRSSDLTSRRSSGSTRYSSDLSSDLEELYESFQPPEARPRPAAIKEEVPPGGASGLQDFVSSMVSNVVDEGSNLAAQMMPGVQNFGEAQPSDVAKPKAFKPTAAPSQDFSLDFPLDLDSSSDSSNQTDDQKAKENIVRFVSQLVEKAFVGAGSSSSSNNNPEDESGPAGRDMDHLHLHHSWSSSDSGGSPHYHHLLEVSARQSEPGHAGGTAGHYCGHHDRGRRLSHPLDSLPRFFTPPVDVGPAQRGAGAWGGGGWGSGGPRAELHRHHDGSPRSSLADSSPRSSHADVSPRMPQFDGSPRSEATAMWRHQEALLLNEVARMSGRRRSSTDFAGSLPPLDSSRQQVHTDTGAMRDVGGLGGRPYPYARFPDPLQQRDSWANAQHGESLTDDLKEAVANSASAFHAVQQAAAAAAAAATGSQDDDHLPCPHVPEFGQDRNVADARLSAYDSRLRGNFQSKSDTSLLAAQHSYHSYQRQDSLDADRHGEAYHSHGLSLSQEGATGFSPYRYSGGPNTAVTVAGQIVQASLETAVRTATQQAQAMGGMAQWRSQHRRDHEGASGGSSSNMHGMRCVNFGRSLSLTTKPRRKGSIDECLSSFAHSLARHGSLGELSSSNRYQQRRGSSGFRDSTLSSFADQLLDTSSHSVADPTWLDLRRHSVGGERHSVGGDRGTLFRRGSGESRSSSLSRHSSMDILFPPCSTPEEPPPWGMYPGRRSSREVVLDLLSSSTTSNSTLTHHRKRQSTLTSHLDWFAQDLLMEAFNDAFIELFGQDYLESFDYQRRQVRHRSRSRSSQNSEDQQLVEFADAFVQDVIQQAIDVMKVEDGAKCRRRRAPSEEEEDGSNYEDALDIPFQMLESFATSLAGNVIDTAKVEVYKRQQRGPHCIATGNWGCGAFRGNPQMKVLLQWAATSCAGAPTMHYYTFNSPDLRRLPAVIESVRRRGWNVGHIMQYVVQYARQRRYTNDETLPSLFDMLLS